MINVNRLSKRYGSHVAVDGVSFSCPPGTITGFLGPNGAGKSTPRGRDARARQPVGCRGQPACCEPFINSDRY
jgi:ABC-type enterochelin transport system ATPase subunit